mgnify:CR=1 FL=1
MNKDYIEFLSRVAARDGEHGRAAEAQLKKFSEDQARDDHGRFASGGAGASSPAMNAVMSVVQQNSSGTSTADVHATVAQTYTQSADWAAKAGNHAAAAELYKAARDAVSNVKTAEGRRAADELRAAAAYHSATPQFGDTKAYSSGLREAGIDPAAKVSSKTDGATLDRMYNYAGHGYGYFGERASQSESARAAGDRLLLEFAANKGWTNGQLAEFCDSKNGRIYGDMVFGGGTKAEAISMLGAGATGAAKFIK